MWKSLRRQEANAGGENPASDPSWFMRALCEPIARMANHQDECTGHFGKDALRPNESWTKQVLLACSMYVDLNPVRAAMAASPADPTHLRLRSHCRVERQADRIGGRDLVVIERDEAGKILRTNIRSSCEIAAKAERRKKNGMIREMLGLHLCRSRNETIRDTKQVRSRVRASDMGFLSMSLSDYVALLYWTASKSARISVARFQTN